MGWHTIGQDDRVLITVGWDGILPDTLGCDMKPGDRLR